jgi:hypothetical protein
MSVNTRRWLFIVASLASLALGLVAILAGLEAMSWVASGLAAVLGVITATHELARTGGGRTETLRPDGGKPRLTGQGWAAVLVGAVAVLFGVAATFRLLAGPAGAAAVACPKPSDPITEAKVTTMTSAAFRDLRTESFVYSLTYNGMDFMHLEAAGRISGKIPEGQLLYPFGSADPKTRDAYDNPGAAGLYWSKEELIVPDPDGCWYKPQRKFGGYAGARGLTFYYHLGLVPHTQIPCLDKITSTKKARDGGVTAADLAMCGVTLLGYAHIPTDRP